MSDQYGTVPVRRPLSVPEIVEQADSIDYTPDVSLKHWVGAAERLYREGQIYMSEGNSAQAYLLLVRHCSLVLRKFPTHPAAKSPEGRRQLKRLNDRIPQILSQLEELKPRITAAYNEWERLSKAGHVSDQRASTGDARYDQLAAKDPALSWNNQSPAQLLDAGRNQELAIRLAQDDFHRRNTARRSTRQAGITEHEEQRRRGGRVWEDWDDWDNPRPYGNVPDDSDSLQRQLQETRRRMDRPDDRSDGAVGDFSRDRYRGGSQRPAGPRVQPSIPSYSYPSIRKSSSIQYEPSSSPRDRELMGPQSYPSRPPKEPYPSQASSPRDSAPPPRPQKIAESHGIGPAIPPAVPTVPDKRPEQQEATVGHAVNELSKRKNVTFLPAGYTEGGKPLRPIFIPQRLEDEFLRIAAANTRKGLELCGIICGRPINNALFASGLLIPNQVCTSDTCETEDEFQIYEFCERENMIIIGWIHTHPTQTCFMSSRDLHTHASYQAISPESIAIVCAPKFGQFGVFRLTDPPGLPHVLSCPHTNTFHQHSLPEQEIYKDAMHPASHVYLSDQIEFEVTDLRPR